MTVWKSEACNWQHSAAFKNNAPFRSDTPQAAGRRTDCDVSIFRHVLRLTERRGFMTTCSDAPRSLFNVFHLQPHQTP